MEKSQKQIKILTKGGKEVTLTYKDIFPIDDSNLVGKVRTYLTSKLALYGSDDDVDYEPYQTIFEFLTGHGHENYYWNLFKRLEDEELEDDLDENGFTYNNKEYQDLMELVDDWLNENYPRSFDAALGIMHAWEHHEAANWDEAFMLYKMGEDITPINGYELPDYMKK